MWLKANYLSSIPPNFRQKNTQLNELGIDILMPGNDLLSHGNSHTIIGAESFHFWVRKGIRWVQNAIVAKQTGYVL